MSQISCKFCLEAVEAAQWSVHIIEKKHQENLPSKILVQGNFESSRIAEVHAYFAQFGKITKEEIGIRKGRFVNLLQYFYENPQSYCTVVHKEHVLWGQKLDIGWCKISCFEEIEKIQDVAFINLKPIINTLLTQSPSFFPEQVATLKNFLQVNTAKVEIAKKAIRDDLSAILSLTSGFHSNKIQFFGSTVMNLAILGSNLDINIQDIPEDIVLSLVTRSEAFVDVQTIIGEFPVIRCRHVATNMMCYLQVGRKLAVRSSELINYYVGLDEKIHSLMLIIKIWAKYHNLGTDGSSYAFYLLVIFFLQQSPYNLPKVVDLQEGIVPEDESGWNCALAADPFRSPALHSSTIADLVFGFFKFYEAYDYYSFIVAPFCGKILRKIFFLSPYSLGKEYQRYTEMECSLNFNCGICIQDPFEHCRSISWKCPLKSSGNFTLCCRESLSLSNPESQLLLALLNQNSNQRIFTIATLEDCSFKQWYGGVKNAIGVILTQILRYTLVKKRPKEIGSFYCSLQPDMWTSRIQTWKSLTGTHLVHNVDDQKTERLISTALQRLPGNIFRLDPIVVRVNADEEQKMARISITGNNRVGPHFDHFLRVKLDTFVKGLIAPAQGPQTTPTITPADLFDELRKHNDDELLQKGGDFSQQVACVLANLRNSPQLATAKRATIQDLWSALMHVVPRHNMRLYGSAVTGLHLLGDPIDICVFGKPTSAALSSALTQSGKFEQIAVVSFQKLRAQTIKCTHVTTKLICHVTVQHTVGLKTTELIRYYVGLDEKVLQLMLILKYWLRCHTKVFPSYAFYMLVIFYLQQEPYKLPAVVDLQKGVTPMMMRSWNYEFAPLRFSSRNLQNATMLELVEGFFKYYESFDHSYVVCPYAGYAIAKMDFLPPYNLPAFYQSYIFTNTVLAPTADMFLQDPFVHSRSLILREGRFVFWGARFTSLCREALPFMRQESQLYNICVDRELIMHGANIGRAKFLTFNLEKPEGYSDGEFTNSVKEVFQCTLTNVLNCTPNNKNVYVYSDIWTKRLNKLKGLLGQLSVDGTEMQKEIVIAKETQRKRTSHFTVDYKFERDPFRAVFTVGGPRRHQLDRLTHYLRVKMVKFMEDIRTTPTLPLNIEKETTVVHESEPINSEFDETQPENSSRQLVQAEETLSDKEEEEGEIIDAEEDEDEVPDNFFDDFLNEDFLSGLDLTGNAEEHDNELSSDKRSESPDRPSAKAQSSFSGTQSRSRDRKISNSRSSSPRRRSRSRDRREINRRSRSPRRGPRSWDRRENNSRSSSPRRRPRSRDRTEHGRSKRRRSSSRKRSRSRSRSRDRSHRRYPRKRRRMGRSSRSLSNSRRRCPSPSPGRLDEAKKQAVIQEIRDKINGVVPVPVPVISGIVPVSSSHPISAQQGNQSSYIAPKPARVPDDDPIHKLFAEKKLSITDYLSILNKRQAKPSLNLEQAYKKIEVVRRCQLFLRGDTLVPFRVRPSLQPKSKLHSSPIHKSIVKLKFTSFSKDAGEGFPNALYNALRRIGIFKDEFDDGGLVDSVAETLTSGAAIDSTLATQLLEISLMGPKPPNPCRPPKKIIDVGTQTVANNIKRYNDLRSSLTMVPIRDR